MNYQSWKLPRNNRSITQTSENICERSYASDWQKLRLCNLCGIEFEKESRYDRYCPLCREGNELYRNVEWAAYS